MKSFDEFRKQLSESRNTNFTNDDSRLYKTIRAIKSHPVLGPKNSEPNVVVITKQEWKKYMDELKKVAKGVTDPEQLWKEYSTHVQDYTAGRPSKFEFFKTSINKSGATKYRLIYRPDVW